MKGSLGPKGLTMSLHGLGRMNAEFSELPADFQAALMTSIGKITPNVNDQEVSNMIYGLGKMRTRFRTDKTDKDSHHSLDMNKEDMTREDADAAPGTNINVNCAIGLRVLSVKAQQGLLDAFEREAWKMTAQGISNTCWGLMLMDAQWEGLPQAVRVAIVHNVARQAQQMDEQEVGNVVYSLGRMGAKWENLPLNAQSILLDAIEVREFMGYVVFLGAITLLCCCHIPHRVMH